MSESEMIPQLLDWSYAGKRAADTPFLTRSDNGKFEIRGCASHRLDPDTGISQERQYKVVNGYLVPHYDDSNLDLTTDNFGLLESRRRRFFDAIEKGLEFEASGNLIASEIEQFDRQLAVINRTRADAGREPFTLTSDHHEWSNEELRVVNRGGSIVGHAAMRLYKLGVLLLEADRLGLAQGYDQDHAQELYAEIRIAGLQDIDPKAEFLDEVTPAKVERIMSRATTEFLELYNKITDSDHQMLVRCVLTHDGRVDHDGLFHHLIREFIKPVMAPIGHFRGNRLRTLMQERDNAGTDAERAVAEERIQKMAKLEHDASTMVRDNIVTEIGYSLEAIDETADIMSVMTNHRMFADFLSIHKRRMSLGEEQSIGKELPMDGYTKLLDEYVGLCRARACVRREDEDNFSPLVTRWRFVGKQVAAYHDFMLEAASKPPRPITTAINTIKLLQLGSSIMGEMAELRLPRNHRSSTIYDQGVISPTDLPDDKKVAPEKRLSEEQKNDMSTIGRFRRKVWLLEHNQLRDKGIEI